VCNGRTEEVHHLKYWLDFVRNYGGNSEAVIFVNKQDEHSVEVPINTLRDKYRIHGNVQVIDIKKIKRVLIILKMPLKIILPKTRHGTKKKYRKVALM
jgi:hypothetical protein